MPPFPYSHGYDALGKCRPICFTGELSEADRHSLHYGEVDMCLKHGIGPEKISYGNTIKKQADIAAAFARGVRLFAFDVAVACPASPRTVRARRRM